MAYIEWQKAYNVILIKKEGLDLASRRLDIVKKSFENGDKPAIDTLESFIALQSRTTDLIKARQDFNNKAQYLNNFLWAEGILPLELESQTIPAVFAIDLFKPQLDSVALMKENVLLTHPILQKYDLTRQQLNLEQRLNREYLKPNVMFNYNPLIRVNDRNSLGALVTENYKLGFDFSYPIFTRKERANIKLTAIALRDNDLEQTIKTQNLRTKIEVLLDNEGYLQEQADLLLATSDNYKLLLDAEYRKLSIGESSMFLVNSREVKYLEFKEKLIKARIKVLENRIKLISQAVFIS